MTTSSIGALWVRIPAALGLLALGVLGLLALGVLVWGHFHRMPFVSVALAAATLLGILIRLLLTLAEVRRREAREAVMMRRAANAERLSAVGRLAGGVAHDFNNVLSVIANSADVAVDAPGVPDSAREDMRRVLKAAQRGSTITDELMRFSRGEATPVETVAVDRVVAELTPLLRRTLGKRARLRVHAGADDATVALRAGELDRVLMNLVGNCCDAMPVEGGKVSVETSLRHAADGRRVVRLRVEDDGEGMSSEVAARAFDPFFTTKPLDAGTGMGLASVHGIVRGAGGMVRLDSSPGRGTLVELELPC